MTKENEMSHSNITSEVTAPQSPVSTPVNHGTVRAEIVEYAEAGRRAVVCELADGWHVVECYAALDNRLRIDHRHVTETLADARTHALAWFEGHA